MLRRLKADVAKSLPPKTETLLYVGMSPMQRELYRSILLRDVAAVLKGASAGALNNMLMHLRKAVNHPYLFEGQEDRSLDPMGDHVVSNCAKLQVRARGGRCVQARRRCAPASPPRRARITAHPAPRLHPPPAPLP